jgi:membrane protease subunit (stomatin/prohibitin family)
MSRCIYCGRRTSDGSDEHEACWQGSAAEAVRQYPDRFDGDAHPGAVADYCPNCGYAAQPGELRGHAPVCPSCGERVRPGEHRYERPEPGANTWS